MNEDADAGAQPMVPKDQRRASRALLTKYVQVMFGHLSKRCVALDLSDTGARVHLLASDCIPELVTLLLPDGTPRPARRRWQQGNQVGFEFLPPSR